MLILKVLVVLTFAGSAVIEMLWLGWAMRQSIAQLPVWMSAAIVAAHLATCFGVASLLDSRQAPRLL